VHHPAVAHRSKQRRKRQIAPQYCRAQITVRHSNRTPRPEGQSVEGAAVLPQCDFTFGASIEVVEDRGWQTAFGEAPQIFNIHDAGRCDGSGVSSHLAPCPAVWRRLTALCVLWFGIAAGIVLHDVRARRRTRQIDGDLFENKRALSVPKNAVHRERDRENLQNRPWLAAFDFVEAARSWGGQLFSLQGDTESLQIYFGFDTLPRCDDTRQPNRANRRVLVPLQNS
jgi:hypothetical protein